MSEERCRCGLDHEAESTWAIALPAGVQRGLPAELVDGVAYPAEPDLELRNCPTGSTISRSIRLRP